ncbi:MAG TPA: aspartate/glutamate racemase family protein [Pirellulales bacterium]|jgi:glutamate racemase|nr:aspartate/glutamate racemase family protein [Pirellulales bacterium]
MQRWGALVVVVFSYAIVRADEAPPATITQFIETVARGDSRLYKIDSRADPNARAALPIGVFDSGIGGLTVLEALLTVDLFDNVTHQPRADGRPDFEQERFIYLADQANMPYGNYCSAGNEAFLRELILRDALFLLGSRYWHSTMVDRTNGCKPPVKAIVVACNTATAYGLDDIRRAVDRWNVAMPVVGVVEAGAAGVVERLPTSDEPDGVAILATVGTCASGAYPRTVSRMAGERGRRIGTIVQHGSQHLAAVIEGDPSATMSVDDCIRDDVAALVERYRQSGATRPIATVVLGCTHFPLEKDRIAAAFARLRDLTDADGKQPYRDLISPELVLVNPAQQTARQLYVELVRSRRLSTSAAAGIDEHRFFITVPAPRTATLMADDGGFTAEYKVGRQAGRFDDEDFHAMPMTCERLSSTTRDMLRSRLPAVCAAWKASNLPAPNVGDLPMRRNGFGLFGSPK